VKTRRENLLKAKSQEFDLVVIGAGQTGAATAQNASERGLQVLLLEKGDFASGFSGKSSQLIYNDMQYAQSGGRGLCRSLSEEREHLQRLAPHLVRETSLILPLRFNNTLFNLKTTVGLSLHNTLNLPHGHLNRHSYLDIKKLNHQSPSISSNRVWGGIQFHDAICDDARLVLELTKLASRQGSTVLNYVQACGFRVDAGKITGVNCHDRYSGQEFLVSCKVCVNTGGAWTDRVLQLLAASFQPPLAPIKSTQIVVAPSAFETNSALLLPAAEGRFVYVLPWHHMLLIGAAESACSDDPDGQRAAKDEIAYLLRVVNSYTDSQRLGAGDVKASFAGVRVQLRQESSKAERAGVARHAIFESDGGLFSLVGTAPVNYRAATEELLGRIQSRHPWLTRSPSKPARTILGGWESRAEFPQKSSAIEIKARRQSIDPASIQHLISNYGSGAEKIVDLVEKQPSLNQRIIADFPVIMAEVPFTITNEMAISLQDFFLRRTRLGLLNEKLACESAPAVAALMGEMLGWDDYRRRIEVSALAQEISETAQIAESAGR
jgi:glycerol-3-phosphate dehydrogenase